MRVSWAKTKENGTDAVRLASRMARRVSSAYVRIPKGKWIGSVLLVQGVRGEVSYFRQGWQGQTFSADQAEGQLE